MSLDDRDWWRKDKKRKEEMYGGDFSLNSKPIKKNNKDIPHENDDTDVLKKPVSLTSAIIFLAICFIGGVLLRQNILVVIIVASIGAVMSEIMKLSKSKRAEAALKAIIYAFTILVIAMAVTFIILLLISKYLE